MKTLRSFLSYSSGDAKEWAWKRPEYVVLLRNESAHAVQAVLSREIQFNY